MTQALNKDEQEARFAAAILGATFTGPECPQCNYLGTGWRPDPAGNPGPGTACPQCGLVKELDWGMVAEQETTTRDNAPWRLVRPGNT